MRIETKLLKTDKEYLLGRKERPLIVNNKKISQEHGKFIVGSYTQEDMVRYVYLAYGVEISLHSRFKSDTSYVPKLEVYNGKSKAMTISRGNDTLVVVPAATYELRDGDLVHLVVGVSVQLSRCHHEHPYHSNNVTGFIGSQ